MPKCILSPSMCQLTRRIGIPDKLAIAGSSSSGKICYAIYHVNHGHLLTRCKELFITTRKRSLGQGNIFTSVCQEFCSQGVPVPAGMGALSRGGVSGPGGVPGPRRVPCPGVCLVLVVPGPGGGCLIPEGCLVPGWGVENSPCGMATAAAVRILLECILALNLRCGCNYHEHSCSFLAASKTQTEKLCAGYRLN